MNLDFNFTKLNTKTVRIPSVDSIYDILVLGGGPAGYNAALYGARKGRKVALIAKRAGGQLLNTSYVDNYLGFAEISGEALSETFRKHLERLDVPILEEANIVSIAKENDLFNVRLSDGTFYQAKTVITTLGSNPRKLNIKGEVEFAGKGVAYCAICDAPLFKDKDVLIAGGGNSAVEAAIDVALFAKSVTLIHRSQLRADQILVDKLYENNKIVVHLETQILEIIGEQAMTGVRVQDKKTQEERIISGDGIFIEIGNIPNTELVKELVTLHENGEVIIDEKGRTDCEGLFASGDMTHTPYKQIIIAAADGAKAALAANEYLTTFNGGNPHGKTA